MKPAEIVQLWHHVNRQMYDIFRSTVRQYDLPAMSYLALRQIQKEPGITISELARRIGTAKSHVSNIADQLVREDFIEKRTDSSDQRILRLYLTRSAFGGLEGMGDRAEMLWAQVIEELPEGELEDFSRFLRKLLDALIRVNDKITDAESTQTSAEGS